MTAVEQPAAERPLTGEPALLTVERFGVQPALDGLRGVAVLIVVAYHAHFPWAAGGWMWMDMFFVLSGFLITTISIGEIGRSGTLRYGQFLLRRLRRLFPLLAVVVAAVVVWAWWGAPANELGAIRRDGLGSLFYVSNWVQIRAGVGYFAQFANPSPLTHTWSLAVEEQYYLIWPLLMIAAVAAGQRFTGSAAADRRSHRAWRSAMRRIGLIAGLGAGLSALTAAALSLSGASSDRIYFGTDTRAQALLIGSGLAVVRWGRWRHADGPAPTDRPSLTVDLFGAGCAVALGLAAFADVETSIIYRGGFTVVALAAAGLVSVAILPGSRVGAVFAVGPLRYVGRISYGIYLWHWPIFAVVNERRTGWSWGAVTVVRLVATLALSALTYVVVEEPFRRRIRWSPWWAAVVAVVLAVALVAVTTGATASDAERFRADQTRNAAPPTTTPVPPVSRVLVVGDSFGSRVAAGWAGTADARVTDATFADCGPYRSVADLQADPSLAADRGVCGDWRTAWPAAIDAAHPDIVVIAVRSWLALSQDDAIRTVDFHYDIAKPQNLMTDELNQVVDLVTSKGATVLLTTSPRTAFTPSEAGAVDLYDRVVPKLVTFRPGDVAELALGASCPPGCTAAAFGLEPSPRGSVPSAAALGGFRTTVATTSRGRHVALVTDHRAADQRPRVLLVGDSVGWSLGTYWYGEATSPPADAPLRVWNRATYECELDSGPRIQTDGYVALSTKCATWEADWASYLDRFDPDLAVTMIGSWEVFDRRIDGRRLRFGTPEWDANMSVIIDRMITVLSSRGARVVLLTQPPARSPAITGTPKEWVDLAEERFGHVNDLIRQVAARHPDVATVIDLASFVCPTSPCPETLQGVVPRHDGIHYDPVGAPIVAGWLTPQLVPLERISSSTGHASTTTIPTTSGAPR